MKITLNNREEHIDAEELTLQELIERKKFSFRLLVTKVNGKLVKRDERTARTIHDGDDVKILHMISGG